MNTGKENSVKKGIAMFWLFGLFACNSLATDLQITNTIYDGNPRDKQNPTLTAWITVTWKNAWRNENNYDAAWIFFKVNAKQESWARVHGFVKQSGHQVMHNYSGNDVNPSFFVPTDGTGLMIFPDRKCRGDVSWRIKVDKAKKQNLRPDVWMQNAVDGNDRYQVLC